MIFKTKAPMTLMKIMRHFFCGSALERRKRHGSSWECNWRPLFGYSVCLTWVLQMSTICWVVWINHPRAEKIIMALVETTSLWSMVLGVMGISVVKSPNFTEKKSQTSKSSSKSNQTPNN